MADLSKLKSFLVERNSKVNSIKELHRITLRDLSTIIDEKYIFGKNKHEDIVISDLTTAKNTASDNKFALIDPALGSESRIFEFKIKKCQWIGLGVCHRNIVADKSYSWNVSLGHGAYMISSDG